LNNLDKLKDIKPIIDIPDYSFYLFCLLIGLIFLLFIFIFYKIYKFFINKKSDEKTISLNALKNIDFTNPKQNAYDITYHGRVVATDNRSKKILADLNKKLSNYKYKKNIENIDEDIKADFRLFLEVLESEK
jgi:cell division protein FtsI/penicillin-binding protein 2